MRTRVGIALALVVCGCSGNDRSSAGGDAGALPSSGPDPVIVRIPRAGGIARAYRYRKLDSLVWRASQAAPSVDRVLGFDAENGVLAYLASSGAPGWLDLRLGTARAASKLRLTSVSSGDGWSIFGVTPTNALLRLTPSGDWTFPSTRHLRRLFPLPDGTLLVLADQGDGNILLRLRPPANEVVDSLVLPRPDRAIATPVGDRVYFGTRRELLGVKPHEMASLERVNADDDILAIAPTPSGDRVFIANKGSPQLEVVDRYRQKVSSSVELPGLVTELRMDPMGRILLARPVSGDSAWMVAIGTQTLMGTVHTTWRTDLPTVTVDGLIAGTSGDDVVFMDPNNGKTIRRSEGGASDLWFFVSWNGFRPRSRELDTPVSFALGEPSPRDTGPPLDSARQVSTDTVRTPVRDSVVAPAPALPEPVVAVPAHVSWTVSFAAVLSEERARQIAATITVDGQHPRVVAGQTDGTTVFRVVFGPFGSRSDADRLGRASKHNYWVYEGVP